MVFNLQKTRKISVQIANVIIPGLVLIKQSKMHQWQRSNSAEFPRQKIYMTSLSQLMERKLTIQPEIQVSNKLFPTRTFAKKLSTSHQRIKNNSQIRTRKFDLHFNSKNAKDLVVQNQRSPTSQPNQRMHRHQSHEIRSNNIDSASLFNTPQYESIKPMCSSTLPQTILVNKNFLEDRPQYPQKNFLRKGSSLQKQIVVNLLRSKLLKERQLNQKKQYSNHQIIKMIQVFKGVSLNDPKLKKGLIYEEKEKLKERPKQKKRSQLKQIKGWDHQVILDYEQTEHQEK